MNIPDESMAGLVNLWAGEPQEMSLAEQREAEFDKAWAEHRAKVYREYKLVNACDAGMLLPLYSPETKRWIYRVNEEWPEWYDPYEHDAIDIHDDEMGDN